MKTFLIALIAIYSNTLLACGSQTLCKGEKVALSNEDVHSYEWSQMIAAVERVDNDNDKMTVQPLQFNRQSQYWIKSNTNQYIVSFKKVTVGRATKCHDQICIGKSVLLSHMNPLLETLKVTVKEVYTNGLLVVTDKRGSAVLINRDEIGLYNHYE